MLKIPSNLIGNSYKVTILDVEITITVMYFVIQVSFFPFTFMLQKKKR